MESGLSSVGRAFDCSRRAAIPPLKGGRSYQNVAGSIPAVRIFVEHRWCSGNIKPFQGFAPGSIPGRCKCILYYIFILYR